MCSRYLANDTLPEERREERKYRLRSASDDDYISSDNLGSGVNQAQSYCLVMNACVDNESCEKCNASQVRVFDKDWGVSVLLLFSMYSMLHMCVY